MKLEKQPFCLKLLNKYYQINSQLQKNWFLKRKVFPIWKYVADTDNTEAVCLPASHSLQKSRKYYLYSTKSQQNLYHDTFYIEQVKTTLIPPGETAKSKHHGDGGKKKLLFNERCTAKAIIKVTTITVLYE